MKKIIYIWINNYKNIIIQQGFQLSPEILIHTKVLSENSCKNIKLSILITDNRNNVVKNFYGQNIASLTAFVGKNGSGKTTVSRMLLEYLPDSLRSNDSLNDPEFLESIGIQPDSKWDSRALYVLYDDKTNKLSICPNHINFSEESCKNDAGIRYHVFNQAEIYGELSAVLNTGIYLTNVFNPSELLETYHKLNLENDRTKFQQMYSPAFFLKYEEEEQQKNLFDNNNFIEILQKLAQSQINSPSFAFLNKQAKLFLASYFHIPNGLRKELHVYQIFDLNVVEFDPLGESFSYVYKKDGSYNDLFYRLEPIDQLLVHLKKLSFQQQSRQKSILYKLYINMLLEVLGVVLMANAEIRHDIAGLFNDVISDLNFDILDHIKDFLLKMGLVQGAWGKQILEFIHFLEDGESYGEKIKWLGETGSHSFEEKKLVRWYYAELQKETSFVKRNLIFRWKPTSSGEMAAANLFSYLHDAIVNLNTGNQKDQKNILIIFDELDCYLHPKWQQCIVGMLLDRLQQYDNYIFQVIITSHSPIILSDICKENILKLDGLKVQIENRNTFGADISTLYYDSFFMNEGDIGNFAKKNIQYVIDELEKESLTDEEKLRFIIKNIGQDIVRKKLWEKYQSVQHRKHTSKKDIILEKINSLTTVDREKVMQYIDQIETLSKEAENHDQD